jgi:two-component system, OmpR family, heavy metal sensor histidine kinase CusS
MSLRSVKAVKALRAWSGSITGRLALLYTLSAFAILVIATGFLYWAFSNNLKQEDKQFLAEKINVQRAIMKERPEEDRAEDERDLEQEVKWERSAPQFTRYYSRVLDEKGKTVSETDDMGDIIPASSFTSPVGPNGTPEEAVKWRRHGKTYLLMEAWAKLGNTSGKKRLLQIALDVSREEKLLADYRQKLIVVIVLGVLFSAGAGMAIARRGMRPLEEITKTVERVTASQLDERVSRAGWPLELRSLATAFDDMLRRLEESFARLSQFSADLAHELRTPINNLMGEAEVALSRTREPEEYRHILESSLEECGRLSSMIDGLLFLARAESAKATITPSVFDARKELDTVVEFYDALAKEQGITVTCRGDASIEADPLLFRRAISNILSNAIRYVPSGGKVDFLIGQKKGQPVEVIASDTGPGIAPEHLPYIFDRFYRADQARTQSSQGTGLGLAIVKSIMELHGGTVEVQSRVGKGTTVTLHFPARLFSKTS